MKTCLARARRICPLLIVLLCGWQTPSLLSEPIRVRHVRGTIEGFLDLRSEDGKLVASGQVVQTVRGDQVTLRTYFTFTDGSEDDETTVFSQRGNFRLITDHHVQKGPFFPHPIDVLVDAASGHVTVRTKGKDGNEEVKVNRLELPPDIANGIVASVIENLRPNSPETEVSMVVATPKARLLKLAISSVDESSFSIGGSTKKATHYSIKIKLGGIEEIAAPLVGKQPPNIEVWITRGDAPTFLREQGPIYPEGPIMTIELASPVWPETPKAGN